MGKCLLGPGLAARSFSEKTPRSKKSRLTTCSKEGADILHGRLATADEHSKSSNCEQLETHHEYASLLGLVCSVAGANGEETSNDIWRDSHQLGTFIGVAHIADDGREEEGDGIERSIYSDGDEHVHIDLPVLECM